MNEQEQFQNHKLTKQQMLKQITYEMVDEIEQEQWCWAVVFNNEGTIMAAGYGHQIKIKELNKNSLLSKEIILSGHDSCIRCLVFSNKQNLFISAADRSISCWKETKHNHWVSTTCQNFVGVRSLLINRNDDELLSCDYLIKVWKVDCKNNLLTYKYSLERHTSKVLCISLNESETSLISSSADGSIIIWGKRQQSHWEFRYYTVNDGHNMCKISFINDNLVALQQGFYGIIDIFELDNGQIFDRPDLQIVLNQKNEYVIRLFSSVYNTKRNIFLYQHSKQVYIIRQQKNGKFKAESKPIESNSNFNSVGITSNGENLVMYSFTTKSLKLYKINYG